MQKQTLIIIAIVTFMTFGLLLNTEIGISTKKQTYDSEYYFRFKFEELNSSLDDIDSGLDNIDSRLDDIDSRLEIIEWTISR
jgi:hypothetical protein